MKEPNYKVSVMILTILQALYEGGLTKFIEDEGDVTYVISPEGEKDEIYIYLPHDFNNVMIETFEKVTESEGVNIIHVYTRNFPDKPEGLPQKFEELLDVSIAHKQGVKFSLNVFSTIITINAPTIDKDSAAAKDLVERITTMDGVLRAIFLFKDGCTRFEDYKNSQPAPAPLITLEVPSRDTPIGKDDVTNLKILLGEVNTVEDLLKNM